MSAQADIAVSSVHAQSGTAYSFSCTCLFLLHRCLSFGKVRSEMGLRKTALPNITQTACDRARKADPEHPNLRPGLPGHLPVLKHGLGKARSPVITSFRSPPALCQAAQNLTESPSAAGLLLFGAAPEGSERGGCQRLGPAICGPGRAGRTAKTPLHLQHEKNPVTLSQTALQLKQLGIGAWRPGMEMPFIALVSLNIPMKSCF